jgi:hypothetical protein
MPKELDEELTQLNYMEKLAIINANIKHLVDYYDDNNMMDMIPDYVWGYILKIEKYQDNYIENCNSYFDEVDIDTEINKIISLAVK